MDGRRALEYERLDQVMPEVDRLLRGHATSGAWTLGQILHHLASSIRLTLESDPGSAIEPIDPEKARVFEVRRRRFFHAGRFPDGANAPHPSLNPPPDAEERASAEALRSLLRRFEDFEGTFPHHPMLGPLSKDEWAAFHRLHCAHHLGFARPTSADPDQSAPEFAKT
jgi:Protein of unknown function (DUF1569)